MDSLTKVARRDFIKSLLLGAVGTSTGGVLTMCTPSRPKPNFVLINVDDLGWTDLTCFGSRYYETPNIDRLAQQGMRFTNAYAACAVCSPTRAAIMTGRYPARVGVTDWIRARFQGGQIPTDKKNPTEYVVDERKKLQCPPNPFWMELDEVTIAEMLRASGYSCCHIGKWHLGADDWYPDKQGFNLNIGGCDYGQPPSYFDPYANKRLANIPTLRPRQEGEYLTDRLGDEAVQFIHDHRSRPFFLNMCFYAVHTPLQARLDLLEKYLMKPPTNQKNPTYAAMVEAVDQAAGKILAALDQLNLVQHTMVIFTSDNGGLVGHPPWNATDNSPLRSGKGYPYEGGIRVPLIVRWPGVVKANSESHVPVTSVDFFPTICKAAHVSLPTNRVIDGENLMPILGQTGRLQREAIYWHFPHYRGDVVPYSIIRAGDWKLIKRYEGNTFELYNLNDDISERNDLADKMPEKVKELDEKLIAWLRACNAKLPRPNPHYKP